MIGWFVVFVSFFVFFKQKTAYEMRISDWSSDVCSSDLTGERVVTLRSCLSASSTFPRNAGDSAVRRLVSGCEGFSVLARRMAPVISAGDASSAKIGRASCRERVCQYV